MTVDIKIILLAIGILFTFQLCLFFLLAIRKKKMSTVKAYEDTLYKKMLPPFATFLYKEDHMPFEVPELKKDRKVVERLLSDFIATNKDEAIENKIQTVAHKYLNDHYVRTLESGTWPDRMNALFYIQIFKMKSFAPLLQKRFSDLPMWDEEKTQLAKTLASFGDLSILEAISTHASRKFYQDIILRYPIETEPTLFERCQQSEDPTFIAAYISYIGNVGKIERLDFIEDHLENSMPAIRIQALKTIGTLFHMNHPAKLKPFFHSTIWQERMVAAQLVKTLKLAMYSDEMQGLLGDSQWWVRYYAAESILEVDGMDRLVKYATTHEDRFARDMAEQWLSTGKKVAEND